jgi:hypothetical protein
VTTKPYCQFCISAKKLSGSLTVIVTSLLTIHTLLQIWHYEWQELPWLLLQFFDVDNEDSLPTWYSASALLLVSALLHCIAQRKRTDGDRWTRYWYGLALAFVALSVDEVAGLHETINTVIDVSWVVPVGIGVALSFIAYIRFLLHLPTRTSVLFVISGCVFIAGAVGVERATDWYAEMDLMDTLAYNLWTVVEEGLEMGGIVLFIYALLEYMRPGESVHIDVNVDHKIR